ncbi:MAG: hypothetical protein NTY19_16545 [Planctomycetota bacterium]|nr:hypothetical protein [Planctomycetota bacterium]
MFHQQFGRLGKFWGVTLVLLTCAGCNAKSGDIAGKVLFRGEPLPAGKISFFCEGGNKPVIARDITAGAYAIPSAPVGEVRVTVVTFQIKQDPVPGAIQSPMPTDVSTASSGPYVAIPDRYRMPDTSGLTYTITAGQQTKNWELTP